MSKNQIAFALMAQMAVLALLYVAAALLAAAGFLPGAASQMSPAVLDHALNYAQVAGMSHVLLELALLSSLIGSAVFVLMQDESPLLKWLFRGWTLLLVLAFFAGALNLLEGRHMLELPPVLDIALIVLLGLWMVTVIRGDNANWGPGKIIWLTGMAFILAAYLVSLLPLNNPLADRVLRVFTVQMRFNVGYVLAGLALAYWWGAFTSLYTVAGAATVVGTLVSFTPLAAIGQNGIPAWLTVLVSVAAWVFIGRTLLREATHEPLRNRWFFLAGILLIVGPGGVGTLTAIPSIAQYTLGTRLSDWQVTMTLMAVLVIVAGFALHCTASLRDHHPPQGEYPAFWLVALGVAGGHLALLVAGGAQTLMERVMGIGYLDVQTALAPLYIVWITGLLVMGFGFFWLAVWGLAPAQTA